MDRRSRSAIGFAVVLILLGGALLAVQLVPGLKAWFDASFDWPVVFIIVGLALLVLGLAVGSPGLAVPACIVAGCGGIVYYQNATGDWTSWSYAWALIPGFVGVGTIIAALFGEGELGRAVRDGLRTIVVSAVLFVVFGSIFGPFRFLGDYWPVLLILLGLLTLVQALFASRK
jgi:hypothetical protein